MNLRKAKTMLKKRQFSKRIRVYVRGKHADKPVDLVQMLRDQPPFIVTSYLASFKQLPYISEYGVDQPFMIKEQAA